MTAGSCSPVAPSPWYEAASQRRNNHMALGTLLGFHREVSTKEAGLHWKQAQLKIKEIQGQVHNLGGPYRDIEVSAKNPAKNKMIPSVGLHEVTSLCPFPLSSLLPLPPPFFAYPVSKHS